MATANRWAMSDRRIFAAIGLAVVGLFIMCCGVGMTNVAVGGLGVAVGVLGPGFIVVSSMRDNVREYVYGTAHVHSVSPPPFTGTTGRCDMHLLVHARGINGVVVRVRDPEVPVRKWPDPGATLPVILPNGNPRRTQVLWDQVRTHADIAATGDVYHDRYLEDDLVSADEFGADLAVDEIPVEPAPAPAPGVAPHRHEPANGGYEVPGYPGEAPVQALADVDAAAAAELAEVDQAAADELADVDAAARAELADAATAVEEPVADEVAVEEAAGPLADIDAAAAAEHADIDAAAQAEVDEVDATAEARLAEVDAAAAEERVEAAAAAGAPIAPAVVPAPRRRPSPRPRRPADPPLPPVPDDTVIVAHAPVPGAYPAESIAVDAAVPESGLLEAPARSAPVEPPSPSHAAELQEPHGPVVPAGGAFIGSPIAEPPLPAPLPPPVPEPAPAPPPIVEPEPADSNGYLAAYLADDTRLATAPGVEHGLHGAGATLIVSDLERSLSFYRDTVGLTEIDSGVGSAVLASGDARILLRRVADMPPVDRRVVHLNLEVDDVHAEYERLRAAGVEFVHRPRVVSKGEQLEQWAATFRDPDGHAIAIIRWEIRQ